MKKIILTCGVLAIAVGAMAQGAVSGFGLSSGVTVSTGSGNQAEFDSGLYSGSLTMQIFFSSTATVNEVNAINALNGVGSAQSLLAGDGFLSVAATITGLTASGENGISGFSTVNLSNLFAAGTIGYYALVFTATSGADSGFSSIIASGNGTLAGGNYGTQVPGTPYNIGSGSTYASFLGSPGFNNIDLTATPEPTTMALAGLGIAGLVALRRKK